MNSGFMLTSILLIYFSLGALMIYIINRKKDQQAASENWLKFWVYFGLICSQFVIIYYANAYFKFVCLCIIFFGLFELIRLEWKSIRHSKLFLFSSLIIFSLLSVLFYSFSLVENSLLLITFFTVSAFDAFSQMIGQILGKNKIVPLISPNKTVSGFIGGIVFAVLTALLIGNIIELEFWISLFLGISISLTAFAGDIIASAVKRRYQVKDFSQLIPGHGGVLDRFDSFIFSGAIVYLINRLI